jgi:hypothetical protein
MTPDCEGHAVARGLCHACYESAFRIVRKGKTTWGELEDLGLVKVAGERGRPPGKFANAMKAAFAKTYGEP